jgi:hypothetical protein
MTASTAIADLIAAQGACDPVLKDATNPHFRSKYASLSSCVDACKEAFHKHNFALLQSNGHDEYGQYVKTELLHTTGASWGSVVYLVLSKQDMQGLGSAITYARRYGLLGMVGLAPEDDDGNAASAPAKPQPKPAPQAPQSSTQAPQAHNAPPIMDLDQWQVWVVDQKRKIDYCSEKYHLTKWAKDTKKMREELAEFDRETMAALKDHYAAKHEELNSGVRR